MAVALAVLAAGLLLFRLRSGSRRESDGSSAADAVPAAPLPRASPAPDAPPVGIGARPADAPAAGAVFEGRVLSSATGQGIPGAELTFSRFGEATGVAAAGDGTFRFAPGASGRWVLATASAPGFLPFAPEWGHSPVLLDARPGERVSGIAVVLAPAIEYLARVLDPEGRPVAGAEVRVLGAATGENALLPLQERFASDARGEVRLVAPDDATLEARHAGFSPGRASIDLAARSSREVVVALRPAGRGDAMGEPIAGRVEDPNGAPAPGALVVAAREGRFEDEVLAQVATGPSGEFGLQELPPGSFRLVATRPGFAPAVLRRVRPGASDVVLRLRAGGALTGRVRDRATGEPVTSFTVAVSPRGRERASGVRAVTVVDAGGSFAVDGLATGPSTVQATAPGRAPSAEVAVDIPAAGAAPARVDLELSTGGRLRGVVLDARTREPLPGAQLEIEGAQSLGASALPARPATVAGPEGRFELSGVPPRPVSLLATAPAHHARILGGLSVGEGDARSGIEVALTPLQPGEEAQVELTGIGAVLASQGASLVIVDTAPGSGALEAGLGRGDEILRIDGRDVAGLTMADAVNLIRGPENSSVILVVRKRDDPQRAELRVVVYRRSIRS